jgi:hypothetical protein
MRSRGLLSRPELVSVLLVTDPPLVTGGSVISVPPSMAVRRHAEVPRRVGADQGERLGLSALLDSQRATGVGPGGRLLPGQGAAG